MLYRSLSLAVTTLYATSLVKKANAQASNAVCVSGYEWSYNSLKQDPCIVSSYLLAQCSTSLVTIPVLPANQHYDPGDTSDCNCNTVVYSLISACADCQTRQFDTWSAWSVNCTTKDTTGFPEQIPPGTAIPDWAFLNVVPENQYNSTKARADTNADHLPQSSSSSSSGTGTASYSFGTNTPTKSSAPSKKKSNIGPIVGGVVGGLALLAFLVGAIFFFFIRKKPQPASSNYQQDYTSDKFSSTSPPPNNGQYAGGYAGPGFPQAQPRLYNPADPTTFPENQPVSPPLGYAGTPAPTGYSATPPPAGYAASPPPGGYSATPPPGGYHQPPAGFQYSGAPQV